MDGPGLTEAGAPHGARRAPSGGVRREGRAAAWELVALVLALDERERLDAGERRRLDREIGVRAGPARGLTLLRAWLAEAPSESVRARIERVRRALALLGWLFLALGVFLGWGAAAALLQIEVHEGRINVVLCLGLLVVVPFGMLVASAVGLVASLVVGSRSTAGRTGATPVGVWLRERALGRLALRLVGPSTRADVEVLLGRMTAHGRLYGRVQRLLLAALSQRIGLGFALGALVATLAFVVFTDLAFGWSTTLDVDARTVHRLVATLAAPWARLWPDAAPTLELVETTRHFRVAAADPHTHLIDPIVYGGWWPFLVMAIAGYGLLPRCVLLVATSGWLARETARAMRLTPGVDRLVERMTTPRVETRAAEAEGEIGRSAPGLAPEVDLARLVAEARDVGAPPFVVRWAEVSDTATIAGRLGVDAIEPFEAGGRASIDEDARAIRAAAAARGALLVAVRAWEPALLDQLDFLGALREAVGRERPIGVLLVDGRARDHEAWRRRLTELGDPWLRVARIKGGGGDPTREGDDPSSGDAQRPSGDADPPSEGAER